jgi:hypothetical protein
MSDYDTASAVIETWLDSYQGEATVAVTEVGIIGYRLRPVTMLDMAGLVSDNGIAWSLGISPVELECPVLVAGMESQLDHYEQQFPSLGPFLETHYRRAWEHRTRLDEKVVIYSRMDPETGCDSMQLAD